MTPTDFPITFAIIDSRSAKRLEAALVRIEDFMAKGLLIKAEFDAIRSDVATATEGAWRKVVQEKYTYNGRWESLSEAERKLEQSFSIAYPHVLPGYLKRAKAAKAAAGPMRNDMIAWLEEIVPLSQQLIQLKGLIGKRAPKATKTSIARDERDAKAMTCQCCARRILAETGKIAHHGYERPGGGYQTSSCIGALELPFEVSRDALGRHIEQVTASLADHRRVTAMIEAETIRFTWAYKAKGETSWKSQDRFVKICRSSFDDALKVWAAERLYQERQPTFDELKARRLTNRREHEHREQAYLDGQKHRFEHWAQTHEWRDGAWAAL
ncbi:hypothetical protein KIKIMORA_00740 [Brevundimonas phage vB_BpoS-Kikimora]|uniref:Uncharacterized protein n=1 Tax=Brevundimonas phage vB_BpoS-Kikimora TaxID=2948601 RepID=A0A9E7SKS0_9CAUD|nr:hypothetical protein KIKIMORA_00740 [Brevundimonas phage vB_BpoS-Kikimora]